MTDTLNELLKVACEMQHAIFFTRSREIMHAAGQEQFQECLKKVITHNNSNKTCEIPVNKQLYDALKALRDDVGAASLVRNPIGRKLRADADQALLAAQFGIETSTPAEIG